MSILLIYMIWFVTWSVILTPLQLFLTGVMYEADNAYSIQSTVVLSAGPISHGSLQRICLNLDLLLIDLLLVFFPSGCVILIQWFLWVFSQIVKLSSSYEMFSSCFWCHFEYKIVLYYLHKLQRKHLSQCLCICCFKQYIEWKGLWHPVYIYIFSLHFTPFICLYSKYDEFPSFWYHCWPVQDGFQTDNYHIPYTSK